MLADIALIAFTKALVIAIYAGVMEWRETRRQHPPQR